MPYSVTDFAAQIKAKYPEYASWPDEHLVTEIVAKHPEYQSWVTLDPRTAIATRAANPPASRFGDPNASPLSIGDIGGAIGKGLAHFVGMPTSMDEVKQFGIDTAGRLTLGPAYDAAKQADGAVRDISSGHVPIIGRPIEAVAAPAAAVARGDAPTRRQNLNAIDAGTQLAASAALAHPAVGAALRAGAEKTGGGLDLSAQREMAGVVDPSGTNPLRETIGDQLRSEGVRMKNPPQDMAQLAREHGAPHDTTSPILDWQGNPTQKTLTPQQQIWDEVAKAAENAKQRQPVTAGAKGRAISEIVIGTAAKVLGVPHSVIAAVLGGSEAVGIARKIMTNPMWKTTSAVVKTDLANALRSGDAAAAINIGSRVLGGLALEDHYGHDKAVHDAVDSAFEQAQGNSSIARQILANQEAVYVNPDGTEIAVPGHITRAFVNQLGYNVPNGDQRMASRDAQTGQGQAGRAAPVPSEAVAHDFAGSTMTAPTKAPEHDFAGNAKPFSRAQRREHHGEFEIENKDLLPGHRIDEILPEHMSGARSALASSPVDDVIRSHDYEEVPAPLGLRVKGMYGEPLPVYRKGVHNAEGEIPEPGALHSANTIQTTRDASDEEILHEYGHAVYAHMSPAQTKQFGAFYDKAVGAYRKAYEDALYNTDISDEAANKAMLTYQRLERHIPQTVADMERRAIDDPGGSDANDEAFAALSATYMLSPKQLKERYPVWYRMMKQVFGGTEYIDGKVAGTKR